MEVPELALKVFAKDHRMRRRGRYAWRLGDDLTSSIWLQKSSWGNQWYVNVGWIVVEHCEQDLPKFDHWHVSTRHENVVRLHDSFESKSEAERQVARVKALLDVEDLAGDEDAARSRQEAIVEALDAYIWPLLTGIGTRDALSARLEDDDFYYACMFEPSARKLFGLTAG